MSLADQPDPRKPEARTFVVGDPEVEGLAKRCGLVRRAEEEGGGWKALPVEYSATVFCERCGLVSFVPLTTDESALVEALDDRKAHAELNPGHRVRSLTHLMYVDQGDDYVAPAGARG